MKYTFVVLFITLVSNAYAHQPVMDMAPRWNNGYGVQTRVEHANSETTTWLEGVYTFKPSLRMTLKVPHSNGKTGDAILAMPIKRYKNAGAFTSNWGLTPSVRMPTGGGSKWDAGLSLSYSSESRKVYTLYDLYTRRHHRHRYQRRPSACRRQGLILVYPVGYYRQRFRLRPASAHRPSAGLFQAQYYCPG